jgi:hypothetical protein
MTRILPALLLASLALPAWGDVVHLKTGGSLEGQVVETDDGVIIKLPEGEIRISKDAIARIEKKTSAFEEYQRRAASLKHDDADGHFQLGLWAQNHDMKNQAKAHFLTVVALQPDHAQARHALGYRRVGDRWMTEEEEMRARGLVDYKGQWMTPEAAARLQALEAELEVAREKRLAAEAELQKARDQLQAAEAQDRLRMPVYTTNPYDDYYATTHLLRPRTYYYSRYGYYGYLPTYGLRLHYGLYGGCSRYPGGYRTFRLWRR